VRNLKDKSVLVTCSGAGMGAAIARRFIEEGANVLITDIDVGNGQAVAKELAMPFAHINISDPASVEGAVTEAVKAFGRLDVMVNNAGINSLVAPIHESTQENWDRVIGVNLSGVYYGMKYALQQFVPQKSGVIVSMASINGLVGCFGGPPYGAAKAGVVQLTREAAIEYAKYGIRANAVAPTAVWTPMNIQAAEVSGTDLKDMEDALNKLNPLPGMPSPEDIASAVVFLASDDARFITGVTLPVDGGYTAQ
jgi:meso-butanediol dehydrogenase/(S,S)-butanediol dehydrogenase/diacetyl reductase